MDFEEQCLLFKEEARLELAIEKERHQEIIQKYKREQEELQAKVNASLSSAPSSPAPQQA